MATVDTIEEKDQSEGPAPGSLDTAEDAKKDEVEEEGEEEADETDEEEPDEAADAETEESEEEEEDDPVESLRLENATLRGQIQQITAQLNGRERPAKQQQEEESEIDPLSAITNESLRKDPAGAIKEALRLQDAKTRKEIQNTTSRATLSLQSQQREESMLRNDFPDLYEDQTYNNFASRLYRESIADAGVDFPGAKYLAAAAAKYIMLKHSGKIPTATKPSLKLKEKMKTPTNPRVNGKETPPRDGGKKDPFHGFSPKQRSQASKIANSLGLTAEQWRKSYDAGMAEDGEE